MSLYDQYRKEHPIASEPSEFREIVESEVKQALEWYKDGCSWCDKLTTRPTCPDAEKLVDELLEMRAQAAIFQRDQDYTTVKTLKSKLLALLAPVVPDEKNLIGAIWNQSDNTFTCQHCGSKHDLGKYKVVKDQETVTPEAGKRYMMHVPVDFYKCDGRLWPNISYHIGYWSVKTLIEEGITFTPLEES